MGRMLYRLVGVGATETRTATKKVESWESDRGKWKAGKLGIIYAERQARPAEMTQMHVIAAEAEYGAIKFGWNTAIICVDYVDEQLVLMSKQVGYVVKSPKPSPALTAVFNSMKTVFSLEHFDDLAFVFNFGAESTYRKELFPSRVEGGAAHQHIEEFITEFLRNRAALGQPKMAIQIASPAAPQASSDERGELVIFGQRVGFSIVVSPEDYAKVRVSGKVVFDCLVTEDQEIELLQILDETLHLYIILAPEDQNLQAIQKCMAAAHYLPIPDDMATANAFFCVDGSRQQAVYDLIDDASLFDRFGCSPTEYVEPADNENEIQDVQNNLRYYAEELVLAMRVLLGPSGAE
ncbi:hypothetical protein SS50377_27288 [Spironucleus salmonicida]|nr:hypothetical protein SS50377_27274 [Spironucleus salmonicida]KAH0570994.1 hypothetical protein SS50377_27288 [Spironucleus salmonicida]